MPVLSAASSVMTDAAPADYVENGPNPYGVPFDSNAMAMVQNELLVSTGGVVLICVLTLVKKKKPNDEPHDEPPHDET